MENSVDTALVLGISGFIGNAVARRLICEGIRVIGIIKPGIELESESAHLNGIDAQIISCDLRNIFNLTRLLERTDLFYNCAWEGTYDQRIADYQLQLENIKWSLNAIKTAAELGCKRYIGIGSVSQLELLTQKNRYIVTERHCYNRAALDCCENMGRALAHDVGIEFAWPILINVYSEDGITNRFINRFAENVMNDVPMKLSSGEQYYDFLHVEDAARALYLVGTQEIHNDCYVIGSGDPKKLKIYLSEAKELLNPSYELEFGKSRADAASIPIGMINSKKFCDTYNFFPEISFESGILRLKEALMKK